MIYSDDKMAARRSGKLDGPIYESIYDSIDDLIVKSNGKNTDEIKALKITIEKLKLEHRLEIAANENEIESKELQIQEMEIQCKKRENQINAKEIEIETKDFQAQDKDNLIKAQEIKIQDFQLQIQTKEDQIKEMKKQLTEKESQLQAKDIQLRVQVIQIEEKKNQLQTKEDQILDKDILLKEKDNQIQAKEYQVLELENENKLLKMKTDDVGEETSDDLLNKGIKKFFYGERICLSNSYKEWFDFMRIRLTKNTPNIFEKCLLVKVSCKAPTNAYYFTSYTRNCFYINQTKLNIFEKEWRHQTTTVSILHPKQINRSLKMKEGLKDKGFNRWKVDYVSKDYIDDEGCFIVVCLKK